MDNFMKSYLQNILIIVTLFSLVFAHSLQANDEKSHLSIQTFERDIDKIYRDINSKKDFNANNCDEYITEITNFLLLESGKRYLPLNHKDFKKLKQRGDVIVEKLFLLRLRLRGKLKKFYLQGDLTPDCVKKIRMAFRYSRFIEEFIIETLVAMDPHSVKANSYNLSQ